MADRLLARADVAARGLFDPAYITALRRRPAGRPYGRERIYRLWSLLLTELWSRQYLDRRGAPLANDSAAAASQPLHLRSGGCVDLRLATGTAHG